MSILFRVFLTLGLVILISFILGSASEHDSNVENISTIVFAIALVLFVILLFVGIWL